MGRCALGTIYYAHICPQGRMLSSSIIKTLHVFLRKQVQTLPTNRGAKYVSLSARHCLLPWLCPGENIFYSVSWKKKKKKKKYISFSLSAQSLQHVIYCRLEKSYSAFLSWNRKGFIGHIWASLPIYAVPHLCDGALEAEILLDVQQLGYEHVAKDLFII